jgi:hypothetical protein
MSNELMIYWITRLDGIVGLFITISVFALVFGIISIVDTFSHDWVEYMKKKKEKRSIMLLSVGFFFCILSVFTPNTKQAIMIYAGGKTLDYIQSDTSLQQIPSKSTELILNKLNEYLKDTKHEQVERPTYKTR